MGNNNNDLALIGNLPQLCEQFPGHHAVQAAVRLVQDEQRRIGDKLHGNGQPLPLSAGQFGHQVAFYRGQAENIHYLFHPALPFRPGETVRQPQHGGIHQCPVDRIAAADQVCLRYKADVILHFLIVFIHVPAIDGHLCLRGLISVHRVQEGGFSRAGTAQQQHHMSGLNTQVDVPEQVFFLKEFPCRPLLKVHRQALVKYRSLSAGEIIIHIIPDFLCLPDRLIFLPEAPQQRSNRHPFRNQPRQDPKPSPFKNPAQSGENPDLIDNAGKEQSNFNQYTQERNDAPAFRKTGNSIVNDQHDMH